MCLDRVIPMNCTQQKCTCLYIYIYIIELLITGLLQLADGTGSYSRLLIWSHPGTDVTGMVATCEKVAKSCEIVSFVLYHIHLADKLLSYATNEKHITGGTSE